MSVLIPWQQRVGPAAAAYLHVSLVDVSCSGEYFLPTVRLRLTDSPSSVLRLTVSATEQRSKCPHNAPEYQPEDEALRDCLWIHIGLAHAFYAQVSGKYKKRRSDAQQLTKHPHQGREEVGTPPNADAYPDSVRKSLLCHLPIVMRRSR
jgi:hypothetical protein